MKKNQALKLLSILSRHDHPVSIAALREQTGLANTSLNRLLNQLIEEMYVQKIRHGEYVTGPALFSLGSSVLNNSFSTRFRPLLEKLSRLTGLNGELYSLSPQGPIMLFWLQGQSDFRVRMYPGYRVQMEENPVVPFFLNRYPQSSCWQGTPREILNDGTPLRDWVKRAGEENYLFEEGHVRPELARCCASLSEGGFVIGLSGLISEFTMSQNELQRLVQQEIYDFEKENL